MPSILNEPKPREARFDAYPEHTDYQDDGFRLFPRCLDCPFAECRYITRHYRGVDPKARAAEILHLAHGKGMSAPDIAAETGVSLRSVFRVMAAAASGKALAGAA